MVDEDNLDEQYFKQIVSMGYTKENAKDYIEAQKDNDVTEIDPNLGLENDEEELEIKLPEIDDSVFASSTSKILLPSEREVNPYARGLAILLLIGCLAGFLNGIDYLSPTSGIIRPHELIYAQSAGAPEKSGIFLGSVVLEDGSPAINYTMNIRSERGGNHFSITDSEGKFRIENLTPGLSLLDIVIVEEENTYGISHRILLNPPAGFEPFGFTQIDLVFPGKNKFGTDNGTGVFWKDYTPEEMEYPLIDPSAATYYSIVGYGFIGIALLGALLSIIALNSGNIGLIRSASVLVFFTMGPIYFSCCIGLIVGLLSFMIPNNEGF